MNVKPYSNIMVGTLLLGVAVALWVMPSDSSAPPPPESSRVLIGRVETAYSRPSARFSGVTQARNRAVLPFAVPGRLAARLVEPGSQVEKGAILARLDDREFRNAVSLAEASVAELKTQWKQAVRDHRRIAKLAASNVATVSDLEKAATRMASLEASAHAADARLKEARRQLEETVLKAPFSGTVTGLYLQAGEWAGPGQPAVELTGDGQVELVVEVPESMVAHLTVGQSVQVLLPFSGDRRVPGRITTVARAALSAGRLFPVKVDLGDRSGLTAGLTAELLFDLPTENVLTAPLAAILNPGASQPYVLICRQGRVTRRPVALGRILGNRIVIRGDVEPEDAVVISGQSRLTDGDQVETVEVTS